MPLTLYNSYNQVNDWTECIHEVQHLIDPLITYSIYDDIMINNDSITINDTKLNCGEEIVLRLKNCTQVVIAVCTIGSKVSYRYNDFINHKDYVRAYSYDIISNAAVNKLIKELGNKLQKDLSSSGLSITSNYSPGNYSWDISEQSILLSLIPSGMCPVSINRCSIMKPTKSVSCIIGIGENVKCHKDGCNHCKSIHCQYRKSKCQENEACS